MTAVDACKSQVILEVWMTWRLDPVSAADQRFRRNSVGLERVLIMDGIAVPTEPVATDQALNNAIAEGVAIVANHRMEGGARVWAEGRWFVSLKPPV